MDDILSTIMNFDGYSRIKHAIPYIFDIEAHGKSLRYFGSPHRRDPHDPIFLEIEEAFKDFKPDVVLVEGRQSLKGPSSALNSKLRQLSRDEAIERHGERGPAMQLALEAGIPWLSPEPSDDKLYPYLEAQGFSRDEIFAWDVIHILPQYRRQMRKNGFREYVQPFIDTLQTSTRWHNFDYSYDRAIKLVEQIIGRPVDVENEPDPVALVHPVPRPDRPAQTVLNRVNRAFSTFRDREIIKFIAGVLKDYDRVFIVYGASHAVMQEPALRKLFSGLLSSNS